MQDGARPDGGNGRRAGVAGGALTFIEATSAAHVAKGNL
jgi:hypothetical protein